MEVVWSIVSFVVTLLIFSYIFGDNPLFRLASYAFVGVAAGYAVVVQDCRGRHPCRPCCA